MSTSKSKIMSTYNCEKVEVYKIEFGLSFGGSDSRISCGCVCGLWREFSNSTGVVVSVDEKSTGWFICLENQRGDYIGLEIKESSKKVYF